MAERHRVKDPQLTPKSKRSFLIFYECAFGLDSKTLIPVHRVAYALTVNILMYIKKLDKHRSLI